MRKSSTAIALLLVVFAGVSPIAHASNAVKEGAPCAKVNQIGSAAGLQFKCVKQQGRIMWDVASKIQALAGKPCPWILDGYETQGKSDGAPASLVCTTVDGIQQWQQKISAAPQATPTAISPNSARSQSPSRSLSSSISPSPSNVVIPPEPKTLDDLISHPESSSYWAWEKSAQQIAHSSATGPKVNVLIGPNTVLPNTLAQTAVDLDSKLYDGFAHPSSVTMIYFNTQDVAWAQQQWSKLALHPSGNEAQRQCPYPRTCVNALTEIDLKGNGFILIASKDPSASDLNHTSGTLEAHEYSHTIQATQFVGTTKEANSYCCTKAYMPWYAVEGNAEFTQAAVIYYKSYTDYLKERMAETSDLLVNQGKIYTQAWYENYLNTSTTDVWKQQGNWHLYDVGFLVSEALASVKGPSINMQLFKDVANGKSWEQAFETDFGVPWADALPKLATILSEISNGSQA